ncbi:MAG: uracil-DNA glycosylase [Proteobacteria bacterium]|nr:uracil-DNA glycosylase [Pseudomonadota bacterium]
MKTEFYLNDCDRLGYQGQLREIVTGLRYHLEEEKNLGLDGWVKSSVSPERKESSHPVVPSSPIPSDLEAVIAELGDCRRCKLHAYRTQIVFGTGNPQAKLVFVGEAPGRDEDLQGEPFVGLAGQLLNKIIQAIQLSREQVYIGNIIKCRPPENRNPEPDEIMACEPFLIKQLQVIRPKLICALGAFAAQALLKTEEKISSLRGKFHEYQGIPLMPTYHPAYLLRNPNRKREVWEDMKKIKREYEKN